MSKKKKEWRAEKERLLSLGKEERRKEYVHYLALDKVATWRQHGSDAEPDEEEEHPVSLCDKVSLYKGDITILELDAIVNAANSSLLGGGGVDGCIHRAAGHFLYDECHTLHGCETGKAKITCGYDLPAKYVIHTVGPIARGNVGPSHNEELRSCYENSLKLVKENKLRSVAFPCISTGIYGFPNEPAAIIALQTAKEWLKENKDEMDRVIFCVFLETDYEIYKKQMSEIFPSDIEECEEGGETPPEDDAEEDPPADVDMASQVVGDEEMETGGTQGQKSENDTVAGEKGEDEKETPAEEEDGKLAGERKPEEEKEKQEQKMGESENAGDSGEEKAQEAPADPQAEQEKDQAKAMETKEKESQGDDEGMDVEDVPNRDKNFPALAALANDNDDGNAKVEVKSQDGIPPEPNQATQADSSQPKDGPADKSEQRKE
ncbi:ADP-ribose glycohydrolase MACROD2 isoform X2 [Salminus brasiliensis]|uniref:ADP-ribose glycohydrolase MACROD2 isoform X2 n=1 Tax=Salminus brasiliensis TaxID=930266 RepID=UPI003B8341CC